MEAGASIWGCVWQPRQADAAPSQSNQSPGSPVWFPQGSSDLPSTYVWEKADTPQEVPKPFPNPKGFRVPGPIWSWIAGEPETVVTGTVPIVTRPGGVSVPGGRDWLISISVLFWICGRSSV